MADETLWELSADAEGVLAAFDEIDAAISSTAEQIDALGASSDSLASLDDILTVIQNQTSTLDADISNLDATMQALAEQVGSVASAVSSLADSLAATQAAEEEAAAGADAAAEQLTFLQQAGEAAAGAMDALQAAQGPLMMIGMAGIGAAAGLIKMGTDAQTSLTTIQALAGATQSQMDQYTTSLEQYSVQFGTSLKSASDGLYYVTSAGFSGKNALTVLKNAMEAASAGGVSMQTTADALTSALNSYGAKASQAQQYTDYMTEAVTQGKQSYSDFASAIGAAATTGHAVGISFDQVSAAEATMTQSGFSAHRAVQDLDVTMRAVALSTATVGTSASKLGLHFNAATYNSDNFIQKLEYLKQISGSNTTAFEKLVGGANGMLAANDLLNNKASAYNGILNAMHHSLGATQKAFETSQHTMSAASAHISAALSVLGYKIVQLASPEVVRVLDGLSQAMGYLTQHTSLLIPVMSGLAAVIGGTVVAALIAFIGPMIAASAPIFGIILAIGLLVAGITLLITHWHQVTAALQSFGKIPAIHELLKAFQDMGAYLVATFKPVIQQVEATFTTQLEPAFKGIWQALQQATPLFEFLGAVIGGVLVVALGLLVGIITGVIRGFAALLTGVVQAIGGIVQIVSGGIQVVLSIFSLLFDSISAIFTGNWGKVGKDFQGLLHGLETMLSGFGNVFMGIFGGIFGAIWGLVSGFVEGVIGFFRHLYDVLVGHSIIPDMVSDILGVFTHLHDEATQIVSTIVSKIGGFFRGLATSAKTWATDMVQGFLDGLSNMTGQLEAGVQNVAGTVAKYLHFSKPEAGPLADADKWMPDMVQLFSDSLNAQTGKLSSATRNIASSLAQVGGMPSGGMLMLSAASAGGGGGGGMQAELLAQIVALLQQQQQQRLITGSVPMQAQLGTVIQQFNGANFNGIQDINGLYQALNLLAGTNIQYGARGVVNGY